jgi:hypothetical protein
VINLDISPIVNAAVAKAVQIEMEKRREEIEEAIRQAKEEAWNEGYLAFPEGIQQFSNPYRKVKPDAGS